MNKNIFIILALILVLFSNTVLGAGWAIEEYFSISDTGVFDARVGNNLKGDGLNALYYAGSTADMFEARWNSGTSQWDTTNIFNSSTTAINSIELGSLDVSKPNPQLYITRGATTNCLYEVYYDGGWTFEVIDASCPGNAQSSAIGDGRGTGTDYLYATDSAGNVIEYTYSGGWGESVAGNIGTAAWGITIANADPANLASKQLYISGANGSIYKVAWNGVSAWLPPEELVSGLQVGRHVYSDDIDNDGLDEIFWNYSTSSAGNIYVLQWDTDLEMWTTDTIASGAFYAYNMGYGDGDNDGTNEAYLGVASYAGGVLTHDIEDGTNQRDQTLYWSSHYMRAAAVGDADNDGDNEVYFLSAGGTCFKSVASPINMVIPATRSEHDFGMGTDYYTDASWSSSYHYFSTPYTNTNYWIDNTPADNDFTWSSNSSLNPGANYSTTQTTPEYWHTNKPVCASGRYISGNYRYDHKFPQTSYWGTDYTMPYESGGSAYVVGLHDNTTYTFNGAQSINAGEMDTFATATWTVGSKLSSDKPVAVYMYFNSPVAPDDKAGQSFFIPYHGTIGSVRATPIQNSTNIYVDADNDGNADETYNSVNVGTEITIINNAAGVHVYADKPIHLGYGYSYNSWDEFLPVEAIGNAWFVGTIGFGGTGTIYAMAIEPGTFVESHTEQALYDSFLLSDFGDKDALNYEGGSTTTFGDKPFYYSYQYTYSSYTDSTSPMCPMSQVAENRLTPRIAALGELQTYKARLFTMDVELTDINGTFYIPDSYTLQGSTGVTVTVAKYGSMSDGFIESATAELTIPAPAGGKYTLQLNTANAPTVLNDLQPDQYIQVSFEVSPNTAAVYEIEPAEFGYTAETYTYTDPLAVV